MVAHPLILHMNPIETSPSEPLVLSHDLQTTSAAWQGSRVYPVDT